MSNNTVLGLPLQGADDLETVSPLSALVIVSAIDEDGDEVHAVLMTDGMSAIQAAGFVAYAQNMISNEMDRITKRIVNGTDETPAT